ncbi:hypothetical protein H257_02238 [Aphanomyces astaci]|uniref:Uncharacterized protein n=1 Tax=Aphanomyces astaci TaxID=112090 RepID=W4H316_APHAT|nr:hypothetical protein H257_02238 [Aphanomyces astaci]ETV85619.1 hypothetical protein H257_02238 [Aphanomyces astaci]|eukprot:XP_009824091.1 hypothetical protein H257_02238 [Aphanomyces astaci]
MESPEQHRARLDRLKAQRSLESPDQCASRLSKLQTKRQLELPEDRGVRLNALKAQYSVQTAEARSSRLGYLKAQRKALYISESVEERKSRLERRRQGLHRVQEANSNDVTASEAQCAALDDATLLHECSKDMKSKILGELGFALGPSGMDQCLCCVCDRLAFTTDVHVYSTEDKDILQSMAALLRNPDAMLCGELVAFYDCKDIDPAFVGLMFSRKGITHAGNVNNIENPKDVDFNVCLECETVLLQPWLSELPRHYVFPGEPVEIERDIDHEFDDNDEHAISYADQGACLYDDPIEDNHGSSIDALAEMEFPDFSEIPVESWPLPPKHAIANHFFVGELPDELFKATWAEMLMCSLVSVVAQTRIIRGGEHRMIRSHLILFDAVPGPPATLLPLKLNRDAMYRVVLAGPFTKDQLVKVKEYHLVRQAMIMDVLQFYKSYNGFYADVSIDGDLIASLPAEDVLDGIIDEALGVDEKASAVDNEQAAVNGFSGDPDEGSSEHECAYVERSVLFTQTASDMAPVNEKAVLESIKSKIHLRTPRADPAVPDFNVHTSNKETTPNVDGTITLAYLAGGIQVKSRFDVQYLKHIPDKATMQQLAMNDNMASDTLFDRSIEAFIKVVVGFDKSTGRPRMTGGLFGHVKAYFGMVETQGRGTLHLHLLVWVHGAPRSTSEYEARFQADLNYEAMVLTYSEGIVSNSLPIDLLQTPCKSVSMRIPKGVLPKEPIMAKCGHCNTMVSSQHLVRQALLHSRPKVWHVELPKLSQPAIDKYLDEEASFLKSTAGKKYDPERTHDHMRASFQTYLAGTVHMESNVDYQEFLPGARASLE